MDAGPAAVDVVIPTIGRPALDATLRSLADAGAEPGCIVVVDDRAGDRLALDVSAAGALADRVRVLRSGARGPAAARNAGWRASGAPWVAFLDDDVVVTRDWWTMLREDLGRADGDPRIAGVQGRIDVPLPSGRRPTDRERNVAGLSTAAWATADMAYRRTVLEAVSGFDERFPRAYREDADLALRVMAAGWDLRRGKRLVLHPVQPADAWISLRQQAGNADDALMRAVHGNDWRARAAAPRGAFARHVVTVVAALTAIAAALTRRRGLCAVAAATWAWFTGSFAWRRIAPGPRTPDEVLAMAATSVAIPFAAIGHRARGEIEAMTSP